MGLPSFVDGLKVLTDAELLDMVAELRDGHGSIERLDELSSTLLQDFCVRQAYGLPLSGIALGWIADALSEILNTRDAIRALRLLPRKKQRPQGPGERDLLAAMWVREAIRRGYTSPEAKALAADLFAVDEKTIARYVAAHQLADWCESEDFTQQYFLTHGKPLPPRKSGGH